MIGFELFKLARSRRPLVAVGCLLLFLVMMLLGFYTYAQARTGGNVEFRYTFENESYFNGLTFSVYALYFAHMLLLPIFACAEGGAQLAGEVQSGTLQLLMARPVSRARLFLSKLVAGFLSQTLLLGIFLAVCMGVGLLAVGWGELSLYPGVLQMTAAPQHLSQEQALWRFALVWPAASIALLAPLSLALLVSAWSKSAVNAVASSVAIYLVLYVVSQVHFFAELRPWLFTSYLAYWRGLFQEVPHAETILRNAAKLLSFSALFLALAQWRFRTREVVG